MCELSDYFSLNKIPRKNVLSKLVIFCISTGACLAKVNTDAVFTAPRRTSVLYPTTGGNLHCFTAVTSCAVLDVLGPPYSDDEGRSCTYYKEYALSNFPGMLLLACHHLLLGVSIKEYNAWYLCDSKMNEQLHELRA